MAGNTYLPIPTVSVVRNPSLAGELCSRVTHETVIKLWGRSWIVISAWHRKEPPSSSLTGLFWMPQKIHFQVQSHWPPQTAWNIEKMVASRVSNPESKREAWDRGYRHPFHVLHFPLRKDSCVAGQRGGDHTGINTRKPGSGWPPERMPTSVCLF